MEVACKVTNKQQLDEKLNLERLRRTEDTIDKLNHVDYISGNDFYTENTVRLLFTVDNVPIYAR
jgi:hypothetical protein